MTSPSQPDPDSSAQPAMSDEDRSRVLSALDIKLKLTLFVLAVLTLLGGAMVLLVSQIFAELTPSTRHDLEWKAQRGAMELAKRMEYGIVLRDAALIGSEAADYLGDADVVKLVVEDADGRVLFDRGVDANWRAIKSLSSGVAHDLGDSLGASATSSIESATVGKVFLFVSKARLRAGQELRRDMLVATACAAGLAFILCLLFVNLYIGPILRLTADAFVRLEAKTEAALEAARLKSQFLANMSHEIRTPMNGILGMIALLQRTKQTATQRRYALTIDNSAQALLSIIDDVLDFSKLEAGKVHLRPTRFDVGEMAQEVVELLAPKAHAKRLEIIYSEAPDVPGSLHADHDRVRQVLTNLLGNAIKFTDVGHVALDVSVVRLEGDEAMIRFAVSDTGMGIAKDDLDKLFQSFSQVDGSLTRAHGGTGLGLAISKYLVEAMGGSVSVESEVGKGSTFAFTIRAGVADQRQKKADTLSPRRARLLVVCGSGPQGEHIERLVTAWGMQVTRVDTCGAAQERLDDAVAAGDSFDVVVVDAPLDHVDVDQQPLIDTCAGEDVPVLLLSSTVASLGETVAGSRQTRVAKPMRVSEFYNGLIGLMDGAIRADHLEEMQVESDGGETSGPSSRPAAGVSVLVVDDNEINRLVAVELLAELGYDADTAENGLEALEKLKCGEFAAVLMDCQMPVMDGYEAVARIRQLDGPVARIPVIALTAHALQGDRNRVLEAGMNDYASKPVKPRTLERLLAHWVQRSEPEGSAAVTTVSVPAQAPGNDVAADADAALVVLDPDVTRSPRAIELFVDTMPTQVKALCDLAHDGTPSAVAAAAHRVKGACLSLGARKSAALFASIEHQARDGHIDVASIALGADRVRETIGALERERMRTQRVEGA